MPQVASLTLKNLRRGNYPENKIIFFLVFLMWKTKKLEAQDRARHNMPTIRCDQSILSFYKYLLKDWTVILVTPDENLSNWTKSLDQQPFVVFCHSLIFVQNRIEISGKEEKWLLMDVIKKSHETSLCMNEIKYKPYRICITLDVQIPVYFLNTLVFRKNYVHVLKNSRDSFTF